MQALPYMEKLDGKKVIIDHNLSSHINEKVIKVCHVNSASFICFPPTSTYLTQPLDIAFFRFMKSKWRS